MRVIVRRPAQSSEPSACRMARNAVRPWGKTAFQAETMATNASNSSGSGGPDGAGAKSPAKSPAGSAGVGGTERGGIVAMGWEGQKGGAFRARRTYWGPDE